MTATNGRLGQFEQMINFSATSTNPRKALYAQDVQWATNTKSLRDQFGVAASDAIADYYSTQTSSYETMISSALTATFAAETAAFGAAKAYSIASLNADGDYSLALFDAEKTKAFAYLAAKVAQIKADYAREAEPTWTRASLNANPSAVAPSFEIDLARDRHNRYASHSWRRARVAANVATRGNTPSSKVDARRNATPKHGRFGSS